MDVADSFLMLMARLRTSDSTAAGDLFQRFAERLLAVARQQITARLRHKVEPEDVVQSVFKSFFLRTNQLEIPNWDSLWGLLTLITVRKCIKHIEREQAARRDARREVSLTTKSNEEWPLVDREPSPEEGAMLAELMEEMLAGFEAEDRPVLEMSLQGHGAVEISTRLGRAERTVRRLREQAKSRLQMRLESTLVG